MSERSAPVLAGADGSASALDAVRAAAREAALRRRPLRIVHAFIWPLMHVDTGPSEAVPEGGLRHDAERILAEAAAAAAAEAPAVEISTDLLTGAPAPVLLHAAREADLVVLGDRGLGGFSGLLLGSVAVQVSSHSRTPVLVVRGRRDPAGPVLLGCDGSAGSTAAVTAAFTAAGLRGAELLAVRVWRESPGVASTPLYDAERARKEELELLQDALDANRGRHAEVRVRTELVLGRAGHELVRLSGQAQLVVVGARGRGGFTGLLLGSVSQQLLHHAACPVLIARDDHTPPA
ncbi:universal stress protein [Catellatospora sp. NPDC049609]|uniref:universal stress protein n=1 Tax=Catellatospora sp. NPDC049609 TaxID=3155505 RepID=UPI00342CC1D5